MSSPEPLRPFPFSCFLSCSEEESIEDLRFSSTSVACLVMGSITLSAEGRGTCSAMGLEVFVLAFELVPGSSVDVVSELVPSAVPSVVSKLVPGLSPNLVIGLVPGLEPILLFKLLQDSLAILMFELVPD
ncbi:hypothetical protein PDJAM_G00202880 [Pangasius djambal]|uniref:Uncharacterized protein n=1 Tax=Pangasius djambal TaxID=1691987 RepID=A0ACC5Y7W7_9TELE|nr:hypothetical protein [Pangasius djambal]